ncbi:ribonuclease H-like domain-containing protein [Terfezia claveryi]|nr:ribonuclease H-like domain-containing protein [Terfezia claveryi]
MTTIIDTTEEITNLIDSITPYLTSTSPPALYLDVEGIDLWREGYISILQLHLHPNSHTYLIDIHLLGERAFTTTGLRDPTSSLKSILESPAIPVVFFDVRNDNDALFHLYGINLKNVHDIQLMELAARPSSKRLIWGLAKTVEQYLHMSRTEVMEWQRVKESGKRLFLPELGGTYAVFNERPITQEIAKYCAQDVQQLPALWAFFNPRLSAYWRLRVSRATEDRLQLCQDTRYTPRGREKALGPF